MTTLAGLVIGWAVGSVGTAFVFALCVVSRDEEQPPDSSCENLRAEVTIPYGLADRMWKNIELRLDR